MARTSAAILQVQKDMHWRILHARVGVGRPIVLLGAE